MPRPRKLHRREIYFYGNVGLPRVVCPKCKRWCIVLRGKTPCCLAPIAYDSTPPLMKRSASPPQERRQLKVSQKREMLADQNYQCAYCLQPFWSIVTRNTYEEILLTVELDHCVPFDYNQDNRVDNIVASCQICNSIKYNFHFRDMNQAREYLRATRKDKGYDF